ncbi:MAG: hypothetical protein ABI551_24475, partial [Polyangiaceae bacterium]
VLMSKGSHSKVEQTNGEPLPTTPGASPAPKRAAFAVPPAVLYAAPFVPAAAAAPILTFSF